MTGVEETQRKEKSQQEKSKTIVLQKHACLL
jgi:hypothetical protein